MVGFIEAVRDGIRATQCGLLGFDEFVLGGIGRLSPGLRDVGLNTVNAYRRILGCDPADDPTIPDPSFSGGQCVGVTYTATYTVTNPNVPNRTFVNPGLTGPVSGFSVGVSGPFQRVFINHGGGVTSEIIDSADSNASAVEGFSVSRVDGLADVCGDPPPEFPPPTQRPITIDITFQPDFGPEITVPITVNNRTFEFNFDGSLRIPFDFDFGGVTFDGSLSLNPEATVNINLPRLPRGINTENPGDDNPGETVPPLPSDRKIIGVVVTSEIVNQGKVSDYSSPGIPPIYVPRLGSVKFAYSFGAATFWSSDIDIKDRRTFIECPFSQGADAVVASPQIGINMTAVPIEGFPLATIDDVTNS